MLVRIQTKPDDRATRTIEVMQDGSSIYTSESITQYQFDQILALLDDLEFAPLKRSYYPVKLTS